MYLMLAAGISLRHLLSPPVYICTCTLGPSECKHKNVSLRIRSRRKLNLVKGPGGGDAGPCLILAVNHQCHTTHVEFLIYTHTDRHIQFPLTLCVTKICR